MDGAVRPPIHGPATIRRAAPVSAVGPAPAGGQSRYDAKHSSTRRPPLVTDPVTTDNAPSGGAFVHLSVHSEYSLVDSTVRVPQLVQACAERGVPAVAIADQCNQFVTVKFYTAAQAAGVKPILGADFWVPERDDEPASRLRLLCRNQAGYINLMRLLSRSYVDGQVRGTPTVQPDWLAAHAEGLIALSGGFDGSVTRAVRAGHAEDAIARTKHWQSVFNGDFFLELERLGRPRDEEVVTNLVDLAALCEVGVVATNAVRFLAQDDFDTHEVRVCIQQGRTLADPRRPKDYTDQQYLKSAAEMRALFADLPEACDNTVAIAQRCNVALDLGRNCLPDFPVPEGRTIETHLRAESEAGLQARYIQLFGEAGPEAEARQRYDERLAHELDVIIGMGFPGYFLIVADFIAWAKRNGVPVGPGRGSGAGSLVAYALGITDVDPLAYDLLFERFLNPERVSMPDFDIDFCMEGRDRVIEYVASRYGQEKVSQIATFGRMAAKAVVRDVGRVMGHPYGFVDGIAKLVPAAVDMTLSKALEESDELAQRRRDEEDVGYLIDTALKLEGLARNVGKHAGGVVIAPTQIDDFSALYCEPGGGGAVTQFDWRDVEAAGLVKFDFLGLRTLTILDWAVKNVAKLGTDIDLDTLPLDDEPTYRLMRDGNTAAVFQLESSGMRRLMTELKPDRFDDIVALVALFRPGPLETGMAADYVARKHDPAQVKYMHPLMENALKPTYGVIVYQEQVMAVAREMAGYSLGAADKLRRAMGKKDAKKMAAERPGFVKGSVERGVDEDLAGRIFDLIAEFAKYGFNKSHSVAYALLAYQTAYLKTHYPAAFMCAVLTADMQHTDKIVPMIEECRRLDIDVRPPDVNSSDYVFSVADERTIRYGLGAIKGVGQGAIEGVIEARASGGAFADLADFCRRIDVKRANRRTLEALIRAGALDSLGPNRPSLLAALPKALAAAEQHAADEAAGQNDLFGAGPGAAQPAAMFTVEALDDWDDRERLQGEKDTLGLYLTGHPLDGYRRLLAPYTSGTIADTIDRAAAAGDGGSKRRGGGVHVRLAALVVDVMSLRNRLIIKLDDGTAQVEATLFNDQAEHFRPLLRTDTLVIVEGRAGVDPFNNQVRLKPQDILGLDELLARKVKGLQLPWRTTDRASFDRLASALEPARVEAAGEGAVVYVSYVNGRAKARLKLGPDWRVRVSEQLLKQLNGLCQDNGWVDAGDEAVKVRYRAAQDGVAA